MICLLQLLVKSRVKDEKRLNTAKLIGKLTAKIVPRFEFLLKIS
jgi:hypothetical protein